MIVDVEADDDALNGVDEWMNTDRFLVNTDRDVFGVEGDEGVDAFHAGVKIEVKVSLIKFTVEGLLEAC